MSQLNNSIISTTVPGLRLNYRAYYATSEDPEYPAQLIQVDYSKDEEYQRTANGWQTKKFCSYPQEIIVQIMSPMRVKQIQILSHQYKISSRIEVYYYFPPKSIQTENQIQNNKEILNSENYMRIGYFSFNENSRSEFQAREMKTLHVDFLAQYIKMVIYQPYENRLNLFQQVGIISMSMIGEPIDGFDQTQGYDKFRDGAYHFPTPNVDASRQKYLSVATVKDSELDQMFQDKINQLKEQRDKAADADDYDRARFLREASDKVKEYGVKILQLMQLKRVAVENEDYETAKKIKLEMDRIRQAISLLDPEKANPSSLATVELKQHLTDSSNKLGQYLQRKPITPIQFEESLKEFEVKVREETKSNASFITAKNPIIEEFIPKPQIRYEDQVIPTIKNGQKKDIEDEIQEYERQYGSIKDFDRNLQRSALSIEEVDEKTQLEQASKLVQFFDKQLVLKLSAPQWQQRDQALMDIIQNMKTQMGQEGYQQAYNSLLTMCMDEKIQQIIVTTVDLIDNILMINKNFKFENHERVLAYLMDKLPDQKLGKKSEDILFKYLDSHKQDYFEIIAFIVSKNSNFNVQTQNSHKLVSKKLQILYNMTVDMDQYTQFMGQSASPLKSSNKLSSSAQIQQRLDYPYHEVFQKLLTSIDHPQQDIRQISLKIVQEIYQKQGFDKIQDFISRLSNKVLINLVKLIPEAEPYLRMNDDRMRAANNTNSYGGGGSFGWAPNLQSTAQKPQTSHKQPPKKSNINKKDQSPEKQKKKVMFKDHKEKEKVKKSAVQAKCQFCGLVDKEFGDDEKLDAHYLNSCLMLTNCPGCTQIIEISAVNSHLLKECSEKAQYKQCPQCKEPHPKDDIEAHKLQDSPGCHAPKPTSQANRCPLCHRDIGPLEKGWKDHLLSKQCPKNGRNDVLD
ncbi:UNKNOWN [Stylonychia lemnae]|uniref:TOG domain-containing protein n=1 Tax=Stylonychia lemnae TaxID=5949 RepID=A0A078A7V1_STYLE|nr:UNKNOWN [Stylonychia lemnae]|eukprot:CDW78329.1 UNKNOWN [Stylonychia lemnae]